ncbi:MULTISPECIES: energy-coupling factor transporter transmembrane protein EcfT [unclassified Mycobacterium]|uniref:energy-coupling factor transporter transmembrane component T family protein n=1 Tax=unclassified Mycobacterium TaxID=2642494 RepID=UPI00089B83CE|nr:MULTISPECIES: energy-coupling factor transporter transmembrane protein EcfT [unclassified Mycobacterium]SEB26281.1 Energy-coupling factor transporter transmembrane protein EcfT [Mycobacterium sp. 283mftsu]
MTRRAPVRHRGKRPLVLLRPVPGTSPVHSLWAGTKIIILVAAAVLLAVDPSPIPIVAVGVLTLAAIWLADIPRSAFPSIPPAMWAVVGIGAVFLASTGGAPVVVVAGLHAGLGGLLQFLQLSALTIVLLLSGAVLSWTTDVADVAPALATLGRPLRALSIPVDDLAVALSLALRSFPMLIDEFRVVNAARTLRPTPQLRAIRRVRQRVRDGADLVATGTAMMLRRADEIGDAIAARGGTGQLTAARTKLGRSDWIALAIAAAVCATAVGLHVITGGIGCAPGLPPGFEPPPSGLMGGAGSGGLPPGCNPPAH